MDNTTKQMNCQCMLCKRGWRFAKNISRLPKAEREWMDGLYDCFIEMEAEQAIREASKTTKKRKKKK